MKNRIIDSKKTCFNCGCTTVYKSRNGFTCFSPCDGVERVLEYLDELEIEELEEGCTNWEEIE